MIGLIYFYVCLDLLKVFVEKDVFNLFVKLFKFLMDVSLVEVERFIMFLFGW